MSKTFQLDTMSTDTLWTLYDDVRRALTVKMTDQQRDIERRLQELSPSAAPSVVPSDAPEKPLAVEKTRRPYPKVMPNYRNPLEPSETWSGRGMKPRWLAAQIANGKTLEQFLIRPKSRNPAKRKPKRKYAAR